MMNTNVQFLKQAKWGVFFHYLASPASSIGKSCMTVDAWNHCIDNFDVNGLAMQLAECGAGYFFITLGQNSGFYLSPNSTYDAIVDHKLSHCSSRDLVSDLYDALSPYGIKLLVYLSSSAPIFDKRAMTRLKFAPPWTDRDPQWCGLKVGDIAPIPGVDSRMSDFQYYWENIIREWSLRWGSKVIGWWIDGCYHPDLMYDFPDEPNFCSFRAAIKAGNPDALVAFAVKCGTMETGGHSDFTAGEMDYSFPVFRHHETVDNTLKHILTFLGDYWGTGQQPRFFTEFIKAWMCEINSRGGIVTWDVPPQKNGLIPTTFMETLLQLKVMSKKRIPTICTPNINKLQEVLVNF